MLAQTRVEKVRKEGYKVLVLQALQKGQFSSARHAARLYNVPNSSLNDRQRGRVARVELRANNHKLTETKELALIQWILLMDERGYPPRICAIHEAAELLLKQRAIGLSALIRKN